MTPHNVVDAPGYHAGAYPTLLGATPPHELRNQLRNPANRSDQLLNWGKVAIPSLPGVEGRTQIRGYLIDNGARPPASGSGETRLRNGALQ